MPDKASFLGHSASVLAENSDYSWLSSVSPESVEGLHKLCDEVYQSLLCGPQSAYQNVQYAERSKRAGMLTVLTSVGVQRHCDVLLGLIHAVVHHRDQGSLVSRMFFDASDGIEGNCERVSLAFLELVDTRYRESQSLPWDPSFPIEVLKTL